MIVVVLFGILAAIAIPNFINKDRDAKVKANCYTLQLAAEDFATQNGGNYPMNSSDQTSTSDSLIDFLPEDQYLINPFTQKRTEPSSWDDIYLDHSPGSISYTPCPLGDDYGYIIRGYDHKGDLLIFLSSMD